jgi:DNA-binding LytR/AlgR family response regulator
MKYSYIILDDDTKSILKIQSVMESFSNFTLLGSATQYDDALNLVLEYQPDFVFLEINPISTSSNLSLLLINELHRYLKKTPKIIAISHDSSKAFEAVKYDVLDFLIKPFAISEVRKALLRFEKTIDIPVIRLNPEPRKLQEFKNSEPEEAFLKEKEISNQPISDTSLNDELFSLLRNEIAGLKEALLEMANSQKSEVNTELIVNQLVKTIEEHLPQDKITVDLEPLLSEIKMISKDSSLNSKVKEEVSRNLICIKSYGDYRFLELDEIAFLKADNNSTDITMNNGEVIIAFKTLKYFEENLPNYFFRIHNSYIVNKNYVSRVHTGNTVCYIKNTKTQLPFSKSYKENVELIIAQLAGSEFKDI